MENKRKKCSLKEHEETDANIFCPECKIYMCNKCINFHSNLFKNHHIFNLDKNIEDIFTGLCQEQNHFIKLEYFCKTHNTLCCSSCIAKVKKIGNCQHSDCNVCTIEDIRLEKKNNLLDNIKTLENLSINIEQFINQFKIICEKMEKEKNELKVKIQNIFTKLRNALNEREEKLLIDVDNKFEKVYFGEDIIKESDKLQDKISKSLERGKIINNEWNENNLTSLINDCTNIENNIKNINIINNKIKNINNIQAQIIISPEESGILESIKNYGNIYDKNQLINNNNNNKKSGYGNLFG